MDRALYSHTTQQTIGSHANLRADHGKWSLFFKVWTGSMAKVMGNKPAATSTPDFSSPTRGLLCRCTLFWGNLRMTGYAMTECWTVPFIIFYQHGTHTYANRTSRNNEYEQYKLAEYKATCNTTVPKLCYDIVMVRQSHGWSQSTNFKTWKSTHERIMIIMTSSSRTKSNSCAAVHVKSAGSVVTVSLVPSQCSDTRVSNTQKTIDLEDDQMLHTHAFNFSQLLASATTTTIHNKNIRSSYQCFISFWNIMKTRSLWTHTRSDNVVVAYVRINA